MKKDARFYFANLGADVARCAKTAQEGDEHRYEESLGRARVTLSYLRASHRPEAYEEGLLLLRALGLAREKSELPTFTTHLNALILPFVTLTPT